MEDFKEITSNDITLDPINNFYLKIENNIDNILKNFFDDHKEKYKHLIDKESEINNNIQQDVVDIKKRKKEMKINFLIFESILIIFSCIFLIGFFFIKKFKKNINDIKAFKNYKKSKNNEIEVLINQSLNIMRNFFLPITLDSIIYYFFNKFGIDYKNEISQKFANLLYKKENVLKIKTSLNYRIKNSPIYDVVYQKLSIEPVITSNSRTYSYTTYESYVDSNGYSKTRQVTEFETLTAYHTENTPFIRNFNSLYYLTNFEKNLIFETNKKKHYLIFENKDFSKKYKVSNNADKIDVSTLNFFSIKAQEDYLKLWSIKNGDVQTFYKDDGYIAINSNPINDLLLKINSEINLIHHITKNKINDAINEVSLYIKKYIENWLDKIILPIISPAINREWYSWNSNYIVNQSSSLDKNDDEHDILYKLNKNNGLKGFDFVKNKYKREPWLIIKNTKKSNKWIEYDLDLKSFNSIPKIDNVAVTGIHVGTKIIPVKYDYFFPVNEPKKAYYIKNEKDEHNNEHFSLNKNLSDIFKNGFWTNFETKINNDNYCYELNNLLKKATNLINENLSFIKNDDGIWIIDNLPGNENSGAKINELKSIAEKIINL